MSEIERYQPDGAHLQQSTDSWTLVLADVAHLSEQICRTDFVPESMRGNAAAVAATILYGREVGLGPLQSLSVLHSIKGKVGLSAEAMRALVLQAGHEIVVVDATGARVTVKGRRNGSQEWTSVTWTIDAARQAKLGGDNWTKYPRAMLAARATAELCRLVFADSIHGLAATEELDDGVLPSGVPDPGPEPGSPPTRVQRRRRPDPEPPTAPPPGRPAPPLPDTPPPAPERQNAAEPPLMDAEPEPVQTADPITPQQRALLMAKFTELDITDRDRRLHITSQIAGRTVDSANQLTTKEASNVIDALATVRDADELEQILTVVGVQR